MVLAFYVKIGVAFSFNSNFAFTFEQNPRPSDKISGKFALSSLFSVGRQSVDIL